MPNYNFSFTDSVVIDSVKIRLNGISFDSLLFGFDDNGDIVISISEKEGVI